MSRPHHYVEKSTGKQERFSRAKLKRSLRRAGASVGLSEQVAGRVEKRVRPGSSTGEIRGHALQCLLEENSTTACKYHLREALFTLGPSGYPFEDFIGAVLSVHGYDTKVGQMIKGACVSHEIDVIASKGKDRAAVECKFHGGRGIRTDVKVALYMNSRFLDLQKADSKYTQVWIVTNTQFTSQAITYAKCSGMRLIGWKYPREGSLEQLVETKGLYPISIFPWLKKNSIAGLIEKNFVLAEDILHARPEIVQKAAQLNKSDTEHLIREAGLLFA